jgi:hypothetical protein
MISWHLIRVLSTLISEWISIDICVYPRYPIISKHIQRDLHIDISQVIHIYPFKISKRYPVILSMYIHRNVHLDNLLDPEYPQNPFISNCIQTDFQIDFQIDIHMDIHAMAGC